MAKKELIIVVPGVKGLCEWPRLIAKPFYSMCRFFGLNPVYEDHPKIWKNKIKDPKSDILWFNWSRNPDLISELLAVKKLQWLIESKKQKIKLVGISLGGEIIIEAIKGQHYRNVKKAILVCSINEIHKFKEKKVKIINIYSASDHFAEAAIETLSLFIGSKRLSGKNVTNINLPGMEHADFCIDKIISRGEYKGKRPSDIVNEFVKD